jgi:hypothetical protein
MAFSIVKYTDDNGKTWKCRLSAAVVAAQPTSPVGSTFDNPLFATVGETKRKYGVHCRHLNLYRPVGTAPNIFNRTTRFPVMLLADVATLLTAGSVVIGGTTWFISSPVGESKR